MVTGDTKVHTLGQGQGKQQNIQFDGGSSPNKKKTSNNGNGAKSNVKLATLAF